MMSVKHQDETVFSQIRVCCVALDDRKAEDLKVLYLGERSSITDYLIIASGNSFASERTLDRRIFVDNVLRTRRNGHGAQRDCNGNGCIAHPHFGHGFLRVN